MFSVLERFDSFFSTFHEWVSVIVWNSVLFKIGYQNGKTSFQFQTKIDKNVMLVCGVTFSNFTAH